MNIVAATKMSLSDKFDGRGMGHPRCLRIYTQAATQIGVLTLVTTISCRLGQSNGSLTCPFAGGVTVCVQNQGVDIFITLR